MIGFLIPFGFVVIGGIIIKLCVFFEELSERKKYLFGKYDVGYAQINGDQETQIDYFTTCYDDNQNVLAAVSNGSLNEVDCQPGAVYALEVLKENFRNLNRYESIQDFLKVTYGEIGHRLSQSEFSQAPGVSLAWVVLKDDKLMWVGVGDMVILLHRGLRMKRLYEGGELAFGEFTFMRDDSCVLLSSDVARVLKDTEFMLELIPKVDCNEKAGELLQVFKKKDNRIQDNAMIAVVYIF